MLVSFENNEDMMCFVVEKSDADIYSRMLNGLIYDRSRSYGFETASNKFCFCIYFKNPSDKSYNEHIMGIIKGDWEVKFNSFYFQANQKDIYEIGYLASTIEIYDYNFVIDIDTKNNTNTSVYECYIILKIPMTLEDFQLMFRDDWGIIITNCVGSNVRTEQLYLSPNRGSL